MAWACHVWHRQVCHAVDLRSAQEKQISHNPLQLLQACEGLHALLRRTAFLSGRGKETAFSPSPPPPHVCIATTSSRAGETQRHPSRERWGKSRENHSWDLLRSTFPKSLHLTLWVLSVMLIVDDLLKAAIWGMDGLYCSTAINN